MANEQNLKPIVTLSNEEAKKRGSAGGKKSVEVRRQRKAMREQMEMLLSLPIKNKMLESQIKKLGVKSDNTDNQMALLVSLYQTALKGNINAFDKIQELIGEKQKQEMEVNIRKNPFEGMTTEELRNLLKEDNK